MSHTGWIATHEGGRVLHFSKHDGWDVQAVTGTDDGYRRGLLDAAKVALDMFDASGKTPAKCGCGQCIAAELKRKAGEA